MKSNYTITFFLFFYCVFPCFGQEIVQKNIFADRNKQKIFIPYQIKYPDSKPIYDFEVRLYFSEDSGKTYLQAKNLTGHFGKNILANEEKLIEWDFLKDKPDFLGKNARFKLEALPQKSVLNLQGAKSAWSSVLVPGLGNSKVKFQKSKLTWLSWAIPVYACIGTSVLMKMQSNQNYQNYLSSKDAPNANNLYAKANQQHQIAILSGVLGLGIWLTDVISVAIKGKKNEKMKKKILEKNKTFQNDKN